MKNKIKHFIEEELAGYSKMSDDDKLHLFGNNVKNVYIENTYDSHKAKLNWDEFECQSDAGIVIEFEDGKCISILQTVHNRLIIKTNNKN